MKEAMQANPQHIAVVMDGNGRWAKKNKLQRLKGHEHGAEAVKQVIAGCLENNIPYVTLYTFSTENWNRPQQEVSGLMKLLSRALTKELPTLRDKQIRLQIIGEPSRLPKDLAAKIERVCEETKDFDKLTLTLALSYSSKEELLQAVNSAISHAKENDLEKVDESTFCQFLYTHNLPDVDLMIRTGGEYRVSNFMLWQIAYAELFFLDIAWPDFKKEHLSEVLETFKLRERRFGKISEQINPL